MNLRRSFSTIDTIITAIMLITGSLFFSSCAQVNLQELSVSGPMTLAPLHVRPSGDSSTVHISPWCSFHPERNRTGRLEDHSPVNKQGIFQVDTISTNEYRIPPGVNIYKFKGKNFEWRLPQINIGTNVDFAISNFFLGTLGVSYARTDDGDSYTAHFGSCGRWDLQGSVVQFEGGLGIQSIWHKVEYIEISSPSLFTSGGSVEFYRDESRGDLLWLYFASTLVIGSQNDLVYPFFQVAINWQSLSDIDIERPYEYSDFMQSEGITLISMSPGISVQLASHMSLVLSMRIVSDYRVTNTNGTFLWVPYVKLDFGL